MRTICESRLCTGCAACSQVCPRGAIDMAADSEGFLYPRINEDMCTDCGLCARTCPVNKAMKAGNKQGESAGQDTGVESNTGSSPDTTPVRNTRRRFYACCSRDEAIRAASSSGGVFSHLAGSVLAEGGVVFGAGFDGNFKVRHVYIEDEKELDNLRRSKYVQSEIGNAFREARDFLEKGRKVLFCGTPCQVAGLKAFLGREYDGLLACDLACHGVPSPKVWEMYLDYIKNRYKSEIKAVSFRDKSTGWSGSSMRIDFANGSKYMDPVKKEIFFIGFGKSVFNRRSCFNCLFRIDNTKADITLADFWGIDKVGPGEFADDRGASLVITHTPAGEEAFLRITDDVRVKEQTYNAAVKYNPRLVSSVPEPPARKSFFKDMESGHGFDRLVNKYMDNKSFKYRMKCMVKRILGRG